MSCPTACHGLFLSHVSVSAIILYLQNHFLLSLPLFDGETIFESLFPQHLMGEKMSKEGAVVVEAEDAAVPLHGVDLHGVGWNCCRGS